MQALAESAPVAIVVIGDVLLPVIVVIVIALLTNPQTLMRTKRAA
jgi:hypothetical protein